MKKVFLVAGMMFMLLGVSSRAYSWEVSVDDFMGYVSYEEDETVDSTNVRSDWGAFYNKTTLFLKDYDNENIEGEVRYGMSVTSKDEEKWYINDIEYQTNDLSFWGVDTGFALGWAIPIDSKDPGIMEMLDITIVPLVGYNWRYLRFTRTNFNVMNTLTIAETVDEYYNLHSVDLGCRLNINVNEKFDIYVKPMFGVLVYNSAHNSALGNIVGDGGFQVNIETGISYPIMENLSLDVAFRTELQRLNGGQKNSVIWPDNALDVFGGNVSVKYKF